MNSYIMSNVRESHLHDMFLYSNIVENSVPSCKVCHMFVTSSTSSVFLIKTADCFDIFCREKFEFLIAPAVYGIVCGVGIIKFLFKCYLFDTFYA